MNTKYSVLIGVVVLTGLLVVAAMIWPTFMNESFSPEPTPQSAESPAEEAELDGDFTSIDADFDSDLDGLDRELQSL